MLSLPELKKLHDKGFALIYLRPKSKRPWESKWTKGPRKPWAELESSFEKSYNVGVRLGEPSKLPSGNFLGCIDCDVKSASRKALKEMNDKLRELGINLQTAPIVTSGRGNGSKHVYVQTATPIQPQLFARSSRRVKVLMPGEGSKPHSKEELALTEAEREAGYRIRPAWEISLMGTGQQTVLPPSVHPDSGFAYAWASPLTVKYLPYFKPPVKNFEQALRDEGVLIHKGNVGAFKPEEVDLYASRLGLHWIGMIEHGAPQGERSEALLSVAMAMCRAGMSDNQILSVLSDPNNAISEAAYSRRQGRVSAVAWLEKYTLAKARYETDIMRRFENKPVFERLSPKEVKKQVKLVEQDAAEGGLPDLDDKKKPQRTLRNMVHALENFMGGGLVGFNEFSARPYFLKDTPYGGVKNKELTDKDDLALKHYLATHYRFEPSKELCFEAHTLLSHNHRYHPVKAYLQSITWDKRPRLDNWLRVAFGATGPSEYLTAVSRKVLTAAVTRVFEPGCKFDYVMVLEGNQGRGKSTALQILASAPWFTDGLGDIHHKDVVDQMTGKWIIELGELASIRKSENESVKAFLSRQVDRVRMSYGRRSEDYARQSIFVGSTNSAEYFNDETGNRRYWPVKIKQADRKWLRDNRDQLWAEAVVRYELGEDLYFTPELEAIAAREQEKRFDVDEWESLIREIVEKSNDETFQTTELYRALTISNGHPSMVESKRIGKVMHRLGFVRKNKRLKTVMSKVWVKRDL